MRMRVARGDHCDAGIAVEEAIAVDIVDDCPFAPSNNEWIGACVRRREYSLITRYDCLRPRSW
jgi:hypothetical protein